jgi:CheY-like chemotaxis protein
MKPKILIVDDEPLNLTTLEAFLSGDGYELHFAENGRDACAMAQTLQPDLILLDVMMPEMDGFAVCRHIRSDPVIGRVPIIVVTALDDDRSRSRDCAPGRTIF